MIEPLLRAVKAQGYTTPTPIQEQAIPHVLEGRDLVGIAQTGTGKTASFALPILQRLSQSQPRAPRAIRVLVLSPTRELASQIAENFNAYGKNLRMRSTVVFGGVGQHPQVDALRRGVEILVATPGRLLDLMEQGFVRLNNVEVFVLDEADRMLDMGFINDVRKIIATLPRERQTLLFSATMPDAIQDLAAHMLKNPVRVEVVPQATTVEKIEQSVYFVDKSNKRALLEHLLSDASTARVLVFTRTKHGANKLVEALLKSGYSADAIHGNKSQGAREKALDSFKRGKTRVLVATDIAARGIDVDNITHVINYELPYEPESYVHRIGRTARAGASGTAFAFCDAEERKLLRDIIKLIRIDINVVTDHPYMSYAAANAPGLTAPPRRQNPQNHAPRNGQGRPQRSSSDRSGSGERRERSAGSGSSGSSYGGQRGNSSSSGEGRGGEGGRNRRRRNGQSSESKSLTTA
ncbi:MAG: DEAD/DEAH box helicase [Pleurocapsa minor GSE-CHR-MK-17-07R]|nr:DEAD/DEAH box helicase [Pleurocapsa minor GSE-CHR-MK 17-07R]